VGPIFTKNPRAHEPRKRSGSTPPRTSNTAPIGMRGSKIRLRAARRPKKAACASAVDLQLKKGGHPRKPADRVTLETRARPRMRRRLSKGTRSKRGRTSKGSRRGERRSRWGGCCGANSWRLKTAAEKARTARWAENPSYLGPRATAAKTSAIMGLGR